MQCWFMALGFSLSFPSDLFMDIQPYFFLFTVFKVNLLLLKGARVKALVAKALFVL